MRKTISLAGVLGAALWFAAPSSADAQQPPKGMKVKQGGKSSPALQKELKGGAKVDLKGVPPKSDGLAPDADLKPEAKGKGKGKSKGKGQEAGEVEGGVDSRAAGVRARREAWKADPEGHKKTLRAEQRAKLAPVLGALAADAAVRAALEHHARRMAKLEWMEELAVEKNDGAALARVDVLRAKELARHEKWMSARTAKPAAGTDEGETE